MVPVPSGAGIAAFEAFASNPRPGEVYNLGGGRSNSASILECITLIDQIGGYQLNWSYAQENRVGDHICYISDLRKLYSHYPQWSIKRNLHTIIGEMVEAEETRASNRATA